MSQESIPQVAAKNRLMPPVVAGPFRRWRRRWPLLGFVVLAWLSMILMAQGHNFSHEASLHASHQESFDFVTAIMMLLMWWGMAIAMMLPTAIPALETLEELNETAFAKNEITGRLAYFTTGFLFVWLVFGLFAAGLQWWLQSQMMLSPLASSNSTELSAALLLLAGIYQWTPWKESCVSRCRSPMAFFFSFWDEGDSGYWRMGLRMGKFCLGCCWAMMLLMFVFGLMNVLWMGLLTLYMYAEKNWIRKPWFDRFTGVVLCVSGLGLLLLPNIN
jgi:predicted metal-binding membrane protein